jgi:hypothetical protein
VPGVCGSPIVVHYRSTPEAAALVVDAVVTALVLAALDVQSVLE